MHLKAFAKICPVDSRRPEPDRIQKAAGIIRRGGVVVFPTLGLYGLGADAFNPAAVGRIFDLKGRNAAKPLLVMIQERGQIMGLVPRVDQRSTFMMDRFWPGRVTLVMPARADLAPGLTSADGKIAIRLAGHPVAAALIAAAGTPITATSANLSGTGGCADVRQIDAELLAAIDLALDAGPMSGAASTIVDICGTRPVVLRAGAVAEAAIISAWQEFERQAAGKHIDRSE